MQDKTGTPIKRHGQVVQMTGTVHKTYDNNPNTAVAITLPSGVVVEVKPEDVEIQES